MENDPTETIELTLTDRIPVYEIEISSKAKTPDVSLNTLAEFSREQEAEDVNQLQQALLAQLKGTCHLATLLPHVQAL